MPRFCRVLVQTPFIVLADLALLQSGFLFSYLLSGGQVETSAAGSSYIHVFPYLLLGDVSSLYAANLYGKWVWRRRRDLISSSVMAVALVAVVTLSVSYWEPEFLFARESVVRAAVIQCVLLSVFRLTLQSGYLAGAGARRAKLVAPDTSTAFEILQKLADAAPGWLRISGYIVASDLDALEQETHNCDTILLAAGMAEQPDIIRQCGRLKKHVLVIPSIQELWLYSARPVEIDDLLLFSIHAPRLTPGRQFVKRLFDIVVSAIVLGICSPLLVIVALAIKMTSKGPAVFTQARLGQNRVEYRIYKFRTMVDDAERSTGPVLASNLDPRITRVGKWLRATRIDELPQVLNVLKGDMSLVGPRPERAYFADEFRRWLPGYDLRFSVKPGITGLAQVAGGYATSAKRKLRFDLMYIFDYSLLQDLEILFRTVLVVLDRQQSEGVRMQAVSVRPAQDEREVRIGSRE